MINPGKPFNIHDYIDIFLRRIWYIIVPFVVIIIGAGLYAYWAPKEYQATTLILVTPQKVPADFVRPTVTSGIEERLQSIGQEIMSRTRLEQVIKELNLYPEELKSLRLEDIVEVMKKNIQVQIRGREGYFSISFIGKDPLIIPLVTNKLASLFIEENLKTREQQAVGTSEFLAIELKATKVKLEEQEKITTVYKRKFMGELPEQREANLRIVTQLQMQYQRNGDSLRDAQERKLMVQKQLADLQILIDSENRKAEEENLEEQEEPILPAPEKPTPQEVKLAQLKNYLEDLRMKYTEKHPDILLVKRQINDLEKEVEQARVMRELEKARESSASLTSPGKTPSKKPGKKGIKKYEIKDFKSDPRYKEGVGRLAAIEKEIERLKEEDAKVKTQIAKYQDRVEQTFERELEMAGLTRDYQNTREAYNTLLRKSQEAQQAENLERRQKGEQFKVIDPARVPEKPFKPDIVKIVLAGLFGGFFCGLACAFLREQMDRSFKDAEDLQVALGFKVLANIPRIETRTT